MRELAPDVWMLRGFQYMFNIHLAGDTLVDAGTRHHRRRILREVAGREVGAVALTHAHPDHQGSAKAVCEALDIPLWCGERDAKAAERGFHGPGAVKPPKWIFALEYKLIGGPGHPVGRKLREGDEIGGGFVALETPGHSRGHLAFWRESDRVLLAGDALLSQHPFFIFPRGLQLPPDASGPNPAQNRESVRRMAALRPSLVCFNHGPPLRDPDAFERFAESLPD